ncbi:MAG: type IV toxin-antitoxin system AbiEi family antitoxin domain-containing protein [Actinomycetota bacterium]
MTHFSPAVHRLLAHQHGVISTEQLHAAGHPPRQVRRLREHGELIAVLRAAYRTPSVHLDELGRCAAVCLARPDLTIAGPTAGRMLGLRKLPADRRIHAIAPPHSQPAQAPWVVPYRTAAIHPHDVVRRDDAIRVTTPARTAFDLARWVRGDSLLSIIEHVIRDHHVTTEELYDTANAWLSPRRGWATRFLEQLARRVEGGAADSHAEVRTAIGLVRRGLTGLVRQHHIELPGYGPARFDLALVEQRTAIEIDVHPSHDEVLGRASDRRRDRAALTLGWTVLRISRSDYLQRFDARLDAVAASCAQAA